MAKLPNKIQDIVDKKQAYIDNNRDKLESSVIKMQEELLRHFIEDIIPEIETKDGQILNTAKNLHLIEKLDEVYAKFNNVTQANVVKNLGQSFLGLSKFNNDYFSEITLNEVTSKRFDQVMTGTNELMSARLGITKKGEINTGGFLDSFVTDRTLLTELKQSIIQNVTGQQSLESYKEFLKTKIVGTPEVSGGFEKYYRTFAYDSYQQYDRAYGKTVADEFGMDYAIYQGGLIEESRDFCKEHENKVYTRDEISEFDKWKLPKDSTESPGPGEVPSYIAKFPNYDPFTCGAGWNCRHSLSWITKSMAERLRPDLKKVIENELPKEATNINKPKFKKASPIIENAESTIRNNQKYETAIAFNSEGKRILYKEGNNKSVALSKEDISILKDAIFTHNHPSSNNFKVGDMRRIGQSFSIQDILVASIADLKEIRAVTTNYTFVMERPINGWPKSNEIKKSYRKADNEIRNDFMNRINKGITTINKAETIHWHEVNKRASKKLGLNYSKYKAI